MGKPVNKIRADRNETNLQGNLQRYCEKALELGATKATIVATEDIPVDERITADSFRFIRIQ
jgi:hypothetical protein